MSFSQSPIPTSPSPASSSAGTRLWRPAAQRNMRNQWSNLSNYRKKWTEASSGGKSYASSLVNSYLSQKYMPLMELGVLSDMPDIRNKASDKLYKQQGLYQSKLVSSYKEMVGVVIEMVNASRSMRCYMKTNSSPLIQFSNLSEDGNDAGDGGGIRVYNFWNISAFEQIAEELVEMFKHEVMLKRLLVLELVSLSCEDPRPGKLSWSIELYNGECKDLTACSLYSADTSEPILPRLINNESCVPSVSQNVQPSREILQIYLTAWLTEVNIDTHRVDEIFALAGDEMHVTL